MRVKPIKGYDDYLICCDGRIISFHKNKVRVLKSRINHRGYVRVGLTRNGKQRGFFVHRLVLSSFVENIDKKSSVNHIDSNPLNNNLYNLEWCTPSENQQHSFYTGRRVSEKRRFRSKLTKEYVLEIRDLHKKGISIRSLADKYGVKQPAISQVINRKTWGYV